MKQIATAGNTVVPALLALEHLGFTVSVKRDGPREIFQATCGEERYVADDPVGVLGLLKLVETRGWAWKAADAEIEEVMHRHGLG
jgi:hypothetical protein